MAEPLKAMYNEEFMGQFMGQFSEKIHAVYGAFDRSGFIDKVMDDTWEELALKARMQRIAEMLGRYLPTRYEVALDILFAIDEDCVGFPYLIFPEFVAVYGQAEKHCWLTDVKPLMQ